MWYSQVGHMGGRRLIRELPVGMGPFVAFFIPVPDVGWPESPTPYSASLYGHATDF
jgi:hypothetical protein